MFNSYVEYAKILEKKKYILKMGVAPISNHLTPVLKIERAFSILENTMKKAITEILKEDIHIFSGDCGTNKTRTVQRSLRKWKSDGFLGRGAIIILSTLEEVDAYISDAGLEKEDYAVYTADEKYKRYGSGLDAAGRVPVLFTTHSMARKRVLATGSFENTPCFFYRGQSRALRIWDEEFLASEGGTFTLPELYQVVAPIKKLGGSHWRVFDDLVQSVERRSGAMLQIPLSVIDVSDALYRSKAIVPDAAKRTLAELVKLAGSVAYMRNTSSDKTEGAEEWGYIGKGRSLPADMGPLFVLDASARLTERYNQLPAHGMTVVHLEPALVAYDRLSIHWWDQPAGKTVMHNRAKRTTIFTAIADLAKSKPGEGFLICMAKEFCKALSDERVGLPDDLAAMIDDPDRVRVVNWGRHKGTNEFREFPNIVIVGDHRYPNEACDALALAASGIEGGSVSLAQRALQAREAFKHNVYQAICRVAVRQRDGAMCGAANAYLIMPDGDWRREAIKETFPGAQIDAWLPIPKKKEKKVDRVLRILASLIEGRLVVSKKELREACGGNSKSYLTPILRDQRFKDGIKALGIVMRNNEFVMSHGLKKAA
ncbi:MAG: hypothetical protein PGN23_13455 [Sphingomonas adhaesiva]|uniref:hypothetical protein n=1 Tax=Sphingomonas adhaesiva TaxID=28212 RepID=UPI002FF73986